VLELFTEWAGGPISPRCLWSIAKRIQNHSTCSVSCRVFVDWCRVVAGGGTGIDNPLLSTGTRGFPNVALVDASLSARRAVLESAVASMQPLIVDMIDSHMQRKGSVNYPATDCLIVRYRLRMVVAAVIGTCAFIFLIITASTRSFLCVGGGKRVGVLYPDDWVSYWLDPYKQLGNDYDSMKTASRVFLYLALAMGLVSVGLMWFAVCRVRRIPQPPTVASISEPGCTTVKQVAKTWSAATVAASLCTLMGALVFLLFGAKECQVPSKLYKFRTLTVVCVPRVGSYLLIASLLLWSFLVVIRMWVAPVYRADNNVVAKVVDDSDSDVTDKVVAGKVVDASEGNVTGGSPEILEQPV
jgi:hypothetical protein